MNNLTRAKVVIGERILFSAAADRSFTSEIGFEKLGS
jgi:hypothetical protein